MPSKQVTDRQKNAALVLAAAQAHVAPAAGEIHKLLSPFVKKSEALPNITLLADLAARMLTHAESDLVAADAAHDAELGDDAGPRDARDAARDTLYGELTELRDWLRGLYGADALRALGFSGVTPTDPVVLDRFAGQVIEALGKPLPKPRRKGVKWDATEMVHTLTKQRDELQHHLADVAREVREAQVTQTAKSNAMDAFDDRYQRVVMLLDGLFRLGGQEALADRLRPAVRKATQSDGATTGGDAPVAPAAPAAPAGTTKP